MIVRHYRPEDRAAIEAMHRAQGFAYELPDLEDPLMLLKGLVEEDGRPRMAALLRLTAEAYLLADPRDAKPRERWDWLVTLNEAMAQGARSRGLRDVQAFLPPQVAKAFGRRLSALGWRNDPWACYTRIL